MHLLLPLLASILFVFGLIFVKRSGEAGAGPITVMFVSNLFTSIAFSFLWLLGGTLQAWAMFWQPAVIAALFMMGLAFTLLSVGRGDVSVAAPIFGVKVVLVAMLLTFVGGETLPKSVWYAAALAALGIALIQWTGRGHFHHIVMTIVFALAAATCFATFDFLVQTWSPAWGPGRFLPVVFWILGLVSLGLAPWVEWSKLKDSQLLANLLPGATFVALQALCITVAVAAFGDAARINVVYALRGLWGVALAWAVAKTWGGAEADHGHQTMVTRMVGAGLLTVAVILVIFARH
ncbi:hypothetical protein Pla52o_23150 [Novipirellula galeiformis]|uniref:EamA domain-containing protein n=1 Tax=Novipirellula galeiformis TaxID=2528004 RepID=A0A5C6CIY9_9BACT|nr:DMT family transporter [Novipirellula galeiformis]TWU24388.1 hypothetical protein Pla52o_23150 [Novipirellula galeiformis]